MTARVGQLAVRLAPLAFWIGLALVAWLMLTPSPPQVLNPAISDLVKHFAAFAALAAAAWISWPQARLRALAALAVLGVALEVAQIPVPGRTFAWSDALADAAGIATVALAAWAFAAVRR